MDDICDILSQALGIQSLVFVVAAKGYTHNLFFKIVFCPLL